ncbi:MAG: hypothetical protein AABX11_00305 [Nanoarchaeota archaeon]
MENQELMQRTQEMAGHAEQLEQHCQFLDQQITEMENFHSNFENLDFQPKTKMLSSLGKGVFIETQLESNNIFVEVGAGVIIKKKPEEVSLVLEHQINALKQSREYFGEQLSLISTQLEKMMHDLDNRMNISSRWLHPK